MDANQLKDLRDYLTQQRDLAVASHDQRGLVKELTAAINGVERERQVVERKRHQHECSLERRRAYKLERDAEVKRLREAVENGNAAREKLNGELADARREIVNREAVIDRLNTEKDELAGTVIDLKAKLKSAGEDLERSVAGKAKAEAAAEEARIKLGRALSQVTLLTAELESARGAGEGSKPDTEN